MSTVKVKYRLSQVAIERTAVEIGEFLKPDGHVTMDFAELQPEVRKELLTIVRGNQIDLSGWPKITGRPHDQRVMDQGADAFIQGVVNHEIDFVPHDYTDLMDEMSALAEAWRRCREEAQPLVEERMAEIEAKEEAERQKQAAEDAEFERLAQMYLELKPEVDRLVTGDDLKAIASFEFPDGYSQNFPHYVPFNFSRYSNRRDELGVESSLSHMLNKRKRQLIDAQREAEKDAWIKEHGSDHLKRAWEAGHHSGRQYAIEMAAAEYPGWELDYNDAAEWSERPFPTVEALDIRDGAIEHKIGDGEPEIVWLTSAPSSELPDEEYDYYGEPFEPCEAVVVFEPRFGKWLVRIV